jgi:hypothetical protein
MNGKGNWFQNIMSSIGNGFKKFMTGRYGNDKLNTVILILAAAVCLIAMFIPSVLLKLFLTLASYGLMFWAIFRSMSRNIYKRYQENRRYLMFLDRIKDREHRYFVCPRCRQPVRVPRGKGKISITCPKCREKFVKKT